MFLLKQLKNVCENVIIIKLHIKGYVFLIKNDLSTER